MVNDVENDVGPVDLFISNAGVGFGDGESGAISAEGGMNPIDDRWTVSWNVNVMAQVYAARAVIPRMLQRGGGYIVNIASAAGLLSPNLPASSDTKGSCRRSLSFAPRRREPWWRIAGSASRATGSSPSRL